MPIFVQHSSATFGSGCANLMAWWQPSSLTTSQRSPLVNQAMPPPLVYERRSLLHLLPLHCQPWTMTSLQRPSPLLYFLRWKFQITLKGPGWEDRSQSLCRTRYFNNHQHTALRLVPFACWEQKNSYAPFFSSLAMVLLSTGQFSLKCSLPT